MFCEKCGKPNAENAVKCKGCGAMMPAKTGCGGFGDILSYENSEIGTKESGVTMTRPIMAPQPPENDYKFIMSIAAIVVSVVALIVSFIAFAVSTSKPVASDDDDTKGQNEKSTEDTKGEETTELSEEQQKAYDYFYQKATDDGKNEEDAKKEAADALKDKVKMREYAEAVLFADVKDEKEKAKAVNK